MAETRRRQRISQGPKRGRKFSWTSGNRGQPFSSFIPGNIESGPFFLVRPNQGLPRFDQVRMAEDAFITASQRGKSKRSHCASMFGRPKKIPTISQRFSKDFV